MSRYNEVESQEAESAEMGDILGDVCILYYRSAQSDKLAEALGNISLACKQRGISRTQSYESKPRFGAHGIEGLVDLPPIHHSHPAAIKPKENAMSTPS